MEPLPFRLGLVGGHCIGVDRYYLTHKAKVIGYCPQIIIAGRRLNDGMGAYVAAQLIKVMIKKSIQIEGARVLVMGLTFKENCPDLRNTRVVDIVSEMKQYNIEVDVYEPWVSATEAEYEYGITPIQQASAGSYDVMILAVAHAEFKDLGAERIRAFGKADSVIYDLKYLLPADAADLRL